MPTYLTGNNTSGLTSVVAVRIRNSDNNFWNTSGTPAFEVYNASNIANYAIACTEIGSTGIYRFLDPGDTAPGTYVMTTKAGGSLVVSDLLNLFWTDNCGPRPANVTQTLGTASAGAAGYMGIDWANITNKTATVALTNTTTSGGGGTVSANVTQWNGADVVGLTETTIARVSDSVGSVLSPVILPPIPPNWITATGITASALNGKGDWLISSSYPTNFSALEISVGGEVTTTVSGFPANFANLAITSSGYVTVGTNLDKTGYSVTSGSVSFIFGSSIPVVIYPISQTGAVTLIKSTDYYADDLRALQWTDTNSIWPVLTGASITLLANYITPANVATVLSLAGSVITATGSEKQIQVEVPASSISTTGSGTYSVSATLADGHLVELSRGPFQILNRP